jgi:hypothetical protein
MKIIITFAILAGAISAQNINKFVISDEAAKKTLVKNEISADTAAKITQACVDWATKNNQAVSVFILSPTGQIVHAHRMDGRGSDQYRRRRCSRRKASCIRAIRRMQANQVANNVSLQLRWDKLPVFPGVGRIADYRGWPDDWSDRRGRRESR